MIQSIFAGISGIKSFQTGIDVLANNIANVNTVGFRGSTTEFSNLFEQQIASSSSTTSRQVGLGSQVSAISLDLQSGEFYQTENVTDLAITSADGWFGVTGLKGDSFYTRAGNFHFDTYSKDGLKGQPFLPYDEPNKADIRLTNADGFLVTGTLANNTANGVLNPVVGSLDLSTVAAQEPLVFPNELSYLVEPTTQADFLGNLGVENVPISVSAQVISPQSERNNLRLLFTQSTPQPASGISWDVVATTQTADGSTVYDTQTGVVTFGESGGLISSTLGTLDNNGAPITVNLGSGFTGLSSNAGPSVVSSSTTDGTLAGELTGYTINRNGEVIADFTNGRQSVVGKVAIYHFQNDQGLEAVTGNLFRTSDNSGKAIFYSQDNGSVLTGTLENSNVALDTALTQLIIMQRSYDAAAKTISTADQLLQNALQMDA